MAWACPDWIAVSKMSAAQVILPVFQQFHWSSEVDQMQTVLDIYCKASCLTIYIYICFASTRSIFL